MKLYYPVKNPINPTNLFGANPAEYAPFGQAGHPGNDFECPTGTPIFSPCDGTAFYVTDQLGGDGIWIRHTDVDGENFNVILWHMPVATTGTVDPGVATTREYPFSIPTDRSFVQVKAGQMLGYTDNSGYKKESTGPHLHVAAMPADKNWNALSPANGYNGCVDPKPFYNGTFAEDINLVPAAVAVVQHAATIVQQIGTSTAATPAEKAGLYEEVKKVVQLLETIL